jgi:hypothetical protein
VSDFDPNDYRKRVLAAVEKRGGPDTSDPFELYDLPLEVDLTDAEVSDRVGEVWGFWQRQRDHPKYRVLVALLVAGHDERSAELLDAGRRALAVARVRAWREQRDTARYALLDSAISRLVARHGGVPRDKTAGLDEVGALAGLTRAEVATRMRRHKVIDPARPTDRGRQVRALLEEFARLIGGETPATLLVLIGLEPSASEEQVRAGAAAWRSRARELPAGRLRAVVDELLVHVADLLEPGRDAVERYLDTVAAEAAERLRPRVRAAVLVEDRLVAEDHAYLLDEAVALGLDRRRATAVIAGLAAELHAPIETAPPEPARPAPRDWEEPLRAARAALRAGRPVEARRWVEQARRAAGADGATPVRAVADEITAVLDEADTRRLAAARAVAARNWVEALEHLEHLERAAADVPGHPVDDLAAARREVAHADAAVAAALDGPATGRAAALSAVLERCPGHPAATAALAQVPLAAPGWVSVTRDGRGHVVVLWEPTADAAGYRVRRRRGDGTWQVVGRVGDAAIEDGGAPAIGTPVYAVSATVGGRSSLETRSDAAPAPAGPMAPVDVRAVRAADGSVRVTWNGTGDVEYRVRSRDGHGSWRVVGRTRATVLEDGGAGPGPLPTYAVSAASGGARSVEVLTSPG